MHSHSDHQHRHQNRSHQSQIAQRQQARTQQNEHTEFANMSREGAAKMRPMGFQEAIQAQSDYLNAASQAKRNNTGLPDNLKSGIENLSGYSMDDVNVHYNSTKPAQLQAHAYAQGTDIHIGAGQEKHLPHEAWHVVQQKQRRVQPTMQMKGNVNINDNASLEQEADVMGARALQVKLGHKLKTQNADNKAIESNKNKTIQRAGDTNKNSIDDYTFLAPLDLSKCTRPSSGRSGNEVLLGDDFVYKLFEPKNKDYNREVAESIDFQNSGGNGLFYKDLGIRRIDFAEKKGICKAVIMLRKAIGKTFMLAKSGHIASFKKEIDNLDRTKLNVLKRQFDNASNAGLKDPQFIWDTSTNTPYFMDIHLGGVKGGGDCHNISNYIEVLIKK